MISNWKVGYWNVIFGLLKVTGDQEAMVGRGSHSKLPQAILFRPNSKVVRMVLPAAEQQKGRLWRPLCNWELVGADAPLTMACNRMISLVAGEGFEPSTFGL
jgi:hypothetical protein